VGCHPDSHLLALGKGVILTTPLCPNALWFTVRCRSNGGITHRVQRAVVGRWLHRGGATEDWALAVPRPSVLHVHRAPICAPVARLPHVRATLGAPWRRAAANQGVPAQGPL
jgi:hypothetical protein